MRRSVRAVIPVAADFVVGFDLFVFDSRFQKRFGVRQTARSRADNQHSIASVLHRSFSFQLKRIFFGLPAPPIRFYFSGTQIAKDGQQSGILLKMCSIL